MALTGSGVGARHKYWTRKLEKAFNKVCTSRQWRDASKVERYLHLCRPLVSRAEDSVSALQARGKAHDKVSHYLEYAQMLTNQVDRRLVQGEVIPQDEKIFSVHEPHTRWIK